MNSFTVHSSYPFVIRRHRARIGRIRPVNCPGRPFFDRLGLDFIKPHPDASPVSPPTDRERVRPVRQVLAHHKAFVDDMIVDNQPEGLVPHLQVKAHGSPGAGRATLAPAKVLGRLGLPRVRIE